MRSMTSGPRLSMTVPGCQSAEARSSAPQKSSPISISARGCFSVAWLTLTASTPRAVLEACRAAAGRSGNLFSLTVPTGGAKTLASMAFALERARIFPDLRRIIVVIPYLSIIEQNAQVFVDALGRDAILEHHSGDTDARDDEEAYENPHQRNAAENWDAPIIVTTSVRFFESLFSHRASDLRRVHNLAHSVVILDEVQTLPRQFIQPILSMMEDLARNWRTTFLFCTATQPAFD